MTLTPDVINAMFEFVGAAMLLNNCRTILKDKMVHGVSISTTAFFMAWGFWNIYFYPHLGQTWSAIAAIIMVSANTWYVYLMWYYKVYKKNKG